jgi:putative transposase
VFGCFHLLMPDHVHLFARAALDGKPLGAWIETWKSISARQLKIPLSFVPPLWQQDYFDQFVRSAWSYREKWDYVAMNPVRKNLCARAEDWPWRGRLHDLWF